MAAEFAQRHLDLVSSEEVARFKIGSKHRKRKNDNQLQNGQLSSMSPFQETKPDRQQKNVAASTKTLVDNGVLWKKFRDDLALSRSCTGAGAKVVLHEFIDKTMKDGSNNGMPRVSSEPLFVTNPDDDSIGRIVSNSWSRVQRRLSMTVSSAFQLDDECASVNSDTSLNSSPGVLVEFDHSVRHRRLSNRIKSRNSASSGESLTKAAQIVANMELDDVSIDDETCDSTNLAETKNAIRRISLLSSTDGYSCIDTVVTEEAEEEEDFSETLELMN